MLLTDWEIFECKVQRELKDKWRPAQITGGLRLLESILIAMFGNPDIAKLVREGEDTTQRLKFSEKAEEVVAKTQWSPNTISQRWCEVRKIIALTTIHPDFTSTMRLRRTAKCDTNPIIGKQYIKGSASRLLLESWIEKLRCVSKNKSDSSLRNIIGFLTLYCSKIGIDINAWPEDAVTVIDMANTEDFLTSVVGTNKGCGKKLHWIQLFLTHVINSKAIIRPEFRSSLEQKSQCMSDAAADDNDGKDYHRIDNDDLTKIYESCKENVFDQLMFMLMITTGLRIGGVVNIKRAAVATLENNEWVIKDHARTLEKGRKWYNFSLSRRTKELIVLWLQKLRPADPSPYLFPGKAGARMTTNALRSRFTKICSDAGLVGPQYHPHAVRHSFAHILLESGNTPHVVGKLMNHSSSATTEKFYLKESAAEVLSRANVPWFKSEEKPDVKAQPLPTFLNEARATQNDKTNAKKRKHNMMKQFGTLNGLMASMAQSDTSM